MMREREREREERGPDIKSLNQESLKDLGFRSVVAVVVAYLVFNLGFGFLAVGCDGNGLNQEIKID